MQSVDGNFSDLQSSALLTAEVPRFLSYLILGNIATTSHETSKLLVGKGPFSLLRFWILLMRSVVSLTNDGSFCASGVR